MKAQNELYLAVLIDTDQDVVCIGTVTKQTWDAHQLLDEPDDIEHIVSTISVPGYGLESSGMDFSLLDIVTKDEEDLPTDGALQLTKDLISAGYTVNVDFAKHLEQTSCGLYRPA